MNQKPALIRVYPGLVFIWLLVTGLLLLMLCACHHTTQSNQVADPVIMPPAGDYTQSQVVSIGTATADAEIYYTVDGSDPSPRKSLYTNPFVVELGTMVKAMATKEGMQNSNIVSAFFTSTVASVVASREPDIYHGQREIALSCSTPLSTIHYTTDGSEPSLSAPLYTAPLLLREKTTLKARAYRSNWTPSAIFSGYYDIRITELIGHYETPGTAYDVAIMGNYAYVADWNAGLQVINISDPTHPVLAGSCSTPSFARGIAVSGSIAYVADWNSGLQIIDIANPANPFIIGSCNTAGTARDVTVDGNYAYVADGDNGLVVIDISNSANPVAVGFYAVENNARSICKQGLLVYLAAEVLWIFDVSNPAMPLWVNAYQPTFWANDIALSDSFAYLADQSNSLDVVLIQYAAIPQLVASCSLPDEALGVAVDQHYACVAAKYKGIQVVDITNPYSPSLVRTCDTDGVAYAVALSGNIILVADGAFGLQLLRLE